MSHSGERRALLGVSSATAYRRVVRALPLRGVHASSAFPRGPDDRATPASDREAPEAAGNPTSRSGDPTRPEPTGTSSPHHGLGQKSGTKGRVISDSLRFASITRQRLVKKSCWRNRNVFGRSAIFRVIIPNRGRLWGWYFKGPPWTVRARRGLGPVSRSLVASH